MFQFAEKRSDIRKTHKSPVLIEDPEIEDTYRARMINYSKNGLFLETNAIIEPGTEVYIGIENSPYRPSTYEAPDGYVAEIMWARNLKDTFFSNAYGIKLISSTYELQNTSAKALRADQEESNHPRRPYHKSVFFTSQNQYYKGNIKNLSRGGAFLETNGNLAVGQVIKLVIPGTQIDMGIMLRSEIIHALSNGVGIRFKSILRPKTK